VEKATSFCFPKCGSFQSIHRIIHNRQLLGYKFSGLGLSVNESGKSKDECKQDTGDRVVVLREISQVLCLLPSVDGFTSEHFSQLLHRCLTCLLFSIERTNTREAFISLPGGGGNEMVWGILWEMIGNRLKSFASCDVAAFQEYSHLIQYDAGSVTSTCLHTSLDGVADLFSAELLQCCQSFSLPSTPYNPMIYEMMECCYAISKAFEIIPLELLTTAKELNLQVYSSFPFTDESSSSRRFLNASKIIHLWKQKIKRTLVGTSCSEVASSVFGLVYRVDEEFISELTVEWGPSPICSSEAVFQYSKLSILVECVILFLFIALFAVLETIRLYLHIDHCCIKKRKESSVD
jgi:hypothetical protein